MRRLGLGTRGWGLALALSALTFVAVFAQPPAVPTQPPPTFRTEANYVRVDVFPTTKDGAPILDLTQADFEVLESGTPQKIEQFEHVMIRAGGGQTSREPNSVGEARVMLENPRARVFVIFLDIGHVTIEGSHRIRQPLTDTLNRIVGPDDLVGVMTPDMSPTDITFARRTETIEGFLARHWDWGESQRTLKKDPIEQAYELCFPAVSAEMIERLHERAQALLVEVGFLHANNPDRIYDDLRTIIARADLDTREATIALGLIRQIEWKLRTAR